MQNFLILFSSSSVGGQSHGVCSTATSTSSVSGLAGTRLWSSGCGHRGKVCEHSNKLRVGSLKVSTLKKTAEVIETVSWRRIDLCYLWETRCRGGLLKTQSSSQARTRIQVLCKQQIGKWRHSTGSINAGWRMCLTWFSSQTGSSSWNWQGHQILYHHVCLCPPAWP